MKKAFALALVVTSAVALAVVAGRAEAVPAKQTAGSLTGAGATFPFPLISKWIPAVDSALGIQITYASVGSGAGIAQVTARTVDFGASDAPLSPDQVSACKGCVQIPWALAGTSIPYNLPGVSGRVRLSGPVLANIYLGSITQWDDPAIKALNPSLSLPSTKITPVYRSDGSGTSYNFTEYLSSVSAQWKSKVGFNTTVNWPAGVGARGSSGVAGVVTKTEGAADLHRRRVLDQEQAADGSDPKPRRPVHAAGPEERRGGGLDAAEEGHELVAAQDRRSGEDGRQGRLSDLDLHLRDRPDELG